MAESALDHIVEDLRSSGSRYFPQHSELKTLRVVGHTPRPDHYTYEIVLDFDDGNERVNAKIYRGKSASRALQELALREAQHLEFARQAADRKKLGGVPRPIGDFADVGAVVSTKVNGLPLQGIVMKVALLPDCGSPSLLEAAARQAGEWLRQFHQATAGIPLPVDGDAELAEIRQLCSRARKDGLPDESTDAILGSAKNALAKQKRAARSSALLREFLPLNVLVSENGVGFAEFAALSQQGHSLYDAAVFLAAVEALEKYPFCRLDLISLVQEAFVQGYKVAPEEEALLDTLKMKVLLQMFAQGRTVKESAERKKVMWANVMKRFLEHAARRAAARAA